MIRFKKCYLATLFLLFSAELIASPESDFRLGVEAFKAGDNAAAATYFESARDQGMNSVSLQYNLASSYYKLERYEEAKNYFNIVNKTPEMRDLAEFNLGLIAIKQKQWRTARRYFTSVKNSGKDEKLTRLSRKQLVMLRNKEDRLTAYVSSYLGFDDNISSVSSDSVLNESATFYDLYGSVNLLIEGTRKEGWSADASIYKIDYLDVASTDEEQYSIGVKKALKLKDWETSAKLNLSNTNYAGEDYLNSIKLELYGRKPISRSERIYFRYQLEDINSQQSVYDYLDGWRQRGRIEYRKYTTKNIQHFYYELELNDRGTLTATSYAYDYSPTRHTVRGIYTHVLDDKWRLTGDASYRISDFPASSTISRNENRLILALSADYRFDSTFKLITKFQYIDNSSDNDQYDYSKSVIKVGLSKSF